MIKKTFHNNRFDSIQALRGIAALFVVLEHVRFLNCGAFGVDIFFCISGFMIMYTTHQSTEGFFKKRLIRILPLYYLMTFATFALLLIFPSMFEQTKADPVFLIKSLLFIPFDIGGGVLQPLVRIGWTVNSEMFFYLLFFVAFKISHKYRGLICSVLLGIVVLLSEVLPLSFAPLTFYGNPVMLEFAMGILCYYIAYGIYNLNEKKKITKWSLAVVLPIFVLLFAGLTLTKTGVNILGFRRLLFWGIPAVVLVLCAFVTEFCIKIPKVLVFLGNISFSLYLIHYYPIMFLDRKVFDFSVCTLYSVIGVIVGTAVCVACAYVSYLVIEKAFTIWLRKKLL